MCIEKGSIKSAEKSSFQANKKTTNDNQRRSDNISLLFRNEQFSILTYLLIDLYCSFSIIALALQ